MKHWMKKFFINNGLFLLMMVIIQIKSILLLSMLRTPGSESVNISLAYFGYPPIWAHVAIITLLLSIIFLFKGRGSLITAIIIDLLVSILFLADISYYRINGTFLSVRHIINENIFNPMGKSLFNFRPVDILFFIDIILLLIAFKLPVIKKIQNNFKLYRRAFKFLIVFVISSIIIGISHYNIDIAKKWDKYALFRIAWAPFQTFSDMSPLGYHGYDLYYYPGKNKDLNETEKKEVQNWIENNKENIPDNHFKGMFKGKNLIALQVESLENFVINQKVNGQEITPTLNKLLSQSLYFDNIYEQNNSGTSSDCDLMVNTSVFPVRQGSTFFGYPGTTYNTLQKLLRNEGYKTISTHPDSPGNWNWTESHKAFGVDEIWDISKFNVDEIIGLGLSDESYLNQIAEKLKNEPQPFYTFLVTLTSHGPFEMPEDKKYLNLPKELDENMLGAYFQSIRYTDEAIKEFLGKLQQEGILKDTVVMIYGDHGGVHKFYNDKITNAPLEGDWWKDDDKKIPFIIYSPGTKGEVINKSGGQVDFLPTISYLLGLDRNKFDNTSMGRVLVNTNKDTTILNYGQIKGTPNNQEEEKHLKDIFKIADYIIQGNYFNQY